MTKPQTEPQFHPLQGLIWPDAELTTEARLYLRPWPETATTPSTDDDPTLPADLPAAPLTLAPDQGVGFDTYFNLFSLGKWRRHCALNDLHLALWGQGRVRVIIGQDRWDDSKPHAQPKVAHSREILLEQSLILPDGNTPVRVDLSALIGADQGGSDAGVLWFALIGEQAGAVLHDAIWQTRQPPLRTPSLALSITTFRREQAVQQSVARFEQFMATSDIADHLHLIVVDNGQSAAIPATAHVTPIDNANLGGAGGFARGLLAARARGDSHCLFMDDDAAVHMDSIARSWRFLAWATDPATAIAGAMSIAAHKWALWENGALFDGHCIPLHLGTDLREPAQLARLETQSNQPAPRNLYGGWWYFAFALDHAHHMPFPFFVRGDDISFGLVHDFNTVTLPGVMSFQDQDFANKESLQTLYLDQRSHLAHHLALPHMNVGRARTVRIAWWFFARAALQLHYDTLDALQLSLEDVLAGPAFFAANADMSVRRADLTALRRDEAWKPIISAPPPERQWINPNWFLPRLVMKLSLNGHLLPLFRLYGNHIVLEPGQRGRIRLTWGAARVTYWDPEAGQYFTVTHSKRRFWRSFGALLVNSWRLWRGYDALLADWQQGYDQLTTPAWWKSRLGLSRD